jgi:hypothetical protein
MNDATHVHPPLGGLQSVISGQPTPGNQGEDEHDALAQEVFAAYMINSINFSRAEQSPASRDSHYGSKLPHIAEAIGLEPA